MNLKAKGQLESHKKAAAEKLAARKSALKEKGFGAAAVQRDSLIKKMKADIRKVDHRLGCIATQEKLNADKVKIKAEKLAAAKEAKDKPPAKAVKDVPAKPAKKEKKKAGQPASDKKA